MLYVTLTRKSFGTFLLDSSAGVKPVSGQRTEQDIKVAHEQGLQGMRSISAWCKRRQEVK